MRNSLLILLLSVLFCSEYQFSLYGAGEKIITSNPSNISLGRSNLFSSNNYLKTSNLSSFYLSDLVRFSFSTDFNFSSINANNYYNQKLNYFSFFIPLKNYKKGLGFSVSPYYRINSNIIENNYNYLEGGVDSDPLAYKTEYSFSGGPSVASILFSSKINNNLSFGFKMDYIFGSLYSYIKHNVFNIDYDINGEAFYTSNSIDQYTSIKNYNGYGFKLETSYHTTKNNLIASFSVLHETEIDDYFYDDIAPGGLELGFDYNNSNNYKISSPFEFNVGYSRLLKNGSFIIEYYLYDPFESNSSILDNSDLNKDKINFGYYTSFLNNNFTIGSGFYMINSYNNSIKSYNQGFTIGLGFNMIKYITADISLEIGKNKIEFSEALNEKYVNLYIGLSASDRWFK
tara:strand:+ start:363 stop:1562 length:1200 start_codon:yes stop_codon:yes gene_type:complete